MYVDLDPAVEGELSAPPGFDSVGIGMPCKAGPHTRTRPPAHKQGTGFRAEPHSASTRSLAEIEPDGFVSPSRSAAILLVEAARPAAIQAADRRGPSAWLGAMSACILAPPY